VDNPSDEIRIPHETAIDLGRTGAPLRDGVNHQRLAAMHIAGCKNMRNAGPERTGFRFHRAVKRYTEGGANILAASGKARGGDQQFTGQPRPVLRNDSLEPAGLIGFQ
jgi:hypothetical protein